MASIQSSYFLIIIGSILIMAPLTAFFFCLCLCVCLLVCFFFFEIVFVCLFLFIIIFFFCGVRDCLSLSYLCLLLLQCFILSYVFVKFKNCV